MIDPNGGGDYPWIQTLPHVDGSLTVSQCRTIGGSARLLRLDRLGRLSQPKEHDRPMLMLAPGLVPASSPGIVCRSVASG